MLNDTERRSRDLSRRNLAVEKSRSYSPMKIDIAQFFSTVDHSCRVLKWQSRHDNIAEEYEIYFLCRKRFPRGEETDW